MKLGGTEFPWGDGTYAFRLGITEIDELEEKTETSIFLLYAATGTELPYIKNKACREVIRLGLIGGGMAPVDAMAKVARYVDERPLTETVAAANLILKAALRQTHGTPSSGEAEAVEPNASTSPPSTPQQS